MKTFQRCWHLAILAGGLLFLLPQLGQAQCATGEVVITVNLLTDNFAGETSWEITDMDGNVVATNPSLASATQYNTPVCLDPCEDYTFTIFDSVSDGICCGFGNGNFSITDEDGNVLGSGAEFGSEADVVIPASGTDCGGGGNCAPGETEITVNLLTDDFAGETSWEITDMDGNVVATNPSLADNTQYNTPVCLDECEDYTFTIFDSFDDGICCTFGNGSFSITDEDGNVLGSGGDFESQASVAIPASGTDCGDTCDGALPIACGDTVSGSTVGATFDNVGTCVTSNTAPGVWYEFAGNGDVVTASTCNQASYDTKISVFSGSCGALNCVTGIDDAAGCSGFTSEVSFASTPGTTYYILVHGFGSATGTFDLSIDCVTPLPNDLCSGAIPMACGDVVSGSTVGATTTDAPGFCGTTLNTAGGVWYSFMGMDGSVEVSTANPGTNYDTKLGVFTGSCGGLVCVDGDDDGGGFAGPSIVLFASMNVTYYVYVTGFGTNVGDFELSIECFPPPANDDICDATDLTEGTPETVNNLGATVQAGEPSPGAGTDGSSCNSTDGWCSFETGVQNSLWYTFTPDATSCYDVYTEGGDLQLAVWTGDCADLPGLVELAANDDGGLGLAPLVSVELTAGVTYWIQVDGFSGTTVTDDFIQVDNTDVADPVINCAGLNRTFDNDPGECGKHVDFAAEGMIPTATDDCNIVVLEFRYREVDDSNSPLSGWSGWIQLDVDDPQFADFFDVGRYRIRWRTFDGVGNKDACTRFLDINDVEPPVITCNDNTEIFNGEEVIWLDPADYVTVDFENCAIESIVLDPPFVTCEQLELNAPIPGVATVTDVNGLSSVCDFNVNLDGLPCGWFVEDGYVDCEGDEDYEGSGNPANSGGGTFFLSSENCHNPSTDNSDEYAFIQTILCGNAEIIAEVTSLTGNAQGWAGVVMRESNDPGSKSVAMMTSLSTTQRAEVRYQTNGITQFSGFPAFGRHWLRISRFGNQFRMYHSFNGITWFLKQAASVSMDDCLQVGLVLNSFVGSGDQSATFNNVSVSGGSPTMSAFQADLGEVEATAPVERTFTAYPNPTTGLTTVNLADYLDTRATLEVVNTFGQVVFQRPLGPIENTQEDLDLSNLPAGVYIIRLHPEEGDMEMIQVVKQ